MFYGIRDVFSFSVNYKDALNRETKFFSFLFLIMSNVLFTLYKSLTNFQENIYVYNNFCVLHNALFF